jgi:acyl carrier protein
MLMTRAAIVVLGCLLLGCGSAAEYETRTSSTRTELDVRAIIAKQLGRSTSSIKPNATFAQLGADDLDLMEIILEIENSRGITIDDDKLVGLSGAADSGELLSRLTVRTFEQVVANSKN